MHIEVVTPPGDDESEQFNSVTLSTVRDTTTSQRLPLGPNFVIQLQEGRWWDRLFLGAIVYADFQNFEDLFNYIRPQRGQDQTKLYWLLLPP